MANELQTNNRSALRKDTETAFIDTDLSEVDAGEYIETVSGQGEKALVASQWKLMWWRFLKHKVALVSAVVILLFYLVGAFAEFVAVNDPQKQHADTAFLPPQRIYFDGFRPFVYGFEGGRNPETFAKEYVSQYRPKVLH